MKLVSLQELGVTVTKRKGENIIIILGQRKVRVGTQSAVGKKKAARC